MSKQWQPPVIFDREKRIDQVIEWRIPLLFVAKRARDPKAKAWQKMLKDAENLRSELTGKTDAEIGEIFEAEKEKAAKGAVYRPEHKERQRFFNQPDAKADFEHWSKAAYWSIDEGLALIMGRTPEVVTPANILPHVEVSPFAKTYAQNRDLALRASKAGLLKNPCPPGIFLAWAKRSITDIPAELIERVEAQGVVIADWQDLYEKLKTQVAEKDATIAALSYECDALREKVAGLEAAKDTELFAGGYRTELMQAMERAINKFWRDYDPSDPDTAPRQDEIIAWLRKVAGSEQAAKAIDLVIRHDSRKIGGKPSSSG
jgi:hypothetical protein